MVGSIGIKHKASRSNDQKGVHRHQWVGCWILMSVKWSWWCSHRRPGSRCWWRWSQRRSCQRASFWHQWRWSCWWLCRRASCRCHWCWSLRSSWWWVGCWHWCTEVNQDFVDEWDVDVDKGEVDESLVDEEIIDVSVVVVGHPSRSHWWMPKSLILM